MNSAPSNHLILRPSSWAMELFGYTPKRRSAFWQWVSTNNVPHIRTGQRKIQFSEQAVLDWIDRRSNTGAVVGG